MDKKEQLLRILGRNKTLQLILDRADSLDMPNWYLGGGCIAQTVWNVNNNFDPENGIKDYDLVYYDADDISYEAEDSFIQKGKELFKDISVSVEIRNQARVHLWYEKIFGHRINQFKSIEESVSTWQTTATSIAIKKDKKGLFQICAPFGLDDLLDMIVRANKVKITENIYKDKIDRWIKIWPNLKVVPWNQK